MVIVFHFHAQPHVPWESVLQTTILVDVLSGSNMPTDADVRVLVNEHRTEMAPTATRLPPYTHSSSSRTLPFAQQLLLSNLMLVALGHRRDHLPYRCTSLL